MSRRSALTATVSAASLALVTVNFGLPDLLDGFTGYVDEARNQVLDAGWGAVFGLVVPAGLLAQLRRPERRIAGVQQVGVAVAALAVAAVAGTAWTYLLLAGALGAVCAAVLALHPARSTFWQRGAVSHRVLALPAVVAVVPALVYAERMASAQRHGLPPADAQTNGLQHWPVMAALALLVVALPLLAALGTPGWQIPLGSAAAAALVWGVSTALRPEAPAAEGSVWAAAAIVWALATLGAGFAARDR